MVTKMKHDMRAIFGEDFFKEEIRCDYRISESQKMMWAMQMDLYLTFSEICEKYNLKYFVMYGCLLGAIRHNGFIPWDDDIDVAMPRKDYDTFIKVAPKELKEPYALQCPYTYPNCYITNITLRNSMGTFTSKKFKKLDYNKGIPLDIFPFDYCDLKKWEEDKSLIFEKVMRCASWMKMQHPELLTEEEVEGCKRFYTDNPLSDWEDIQKIASNPVYNGSEDMMMKVILDKYHLERTIAYKTAWFEKTITHKFETVDVKIPIGWHEILSMRYGKDYMEYPPIEKRGAINNFLIVDPYTPYNQFDFDK